MCLNKKFINILIPLKNLNICSFLRAKNNFKKISLSNVVSLMLPVPNVLKVTNFLLLNPLQTPYVTT